MSAYSDYGGNTPAYRNTVNKRLCCNIIPENTSMLSATMTERGLIESLLEVADEQEGAERDWPISVSLEEADAITPWCDFAPNVRIIPPRKKRPHVHSADEAMTRTRNRVEEYSRYNRKTVESLFTSAALWRMCVEQTTYRYIPNNGRYRASKVEHKLDRDSKLARTIRSMEKLSPEQRHLQKEIQRQLRQEFEMQQKLERQAERSRLRAAEARRLDSRGQPRSLDDQHPDRAAVAQRRLGKDPLFHRRIKTPVELPPITVPLLGRAVNETYMESFNVRLTSLEEEMKRDQFMLKKKQQEYAEENGSMSADHIYRTRSDPNPASNGKSSHYMDFSGMPLFTEPVAEDCLSVRPIQGQSKGSMERADVDDTNGNLISSRSTRSTADEENMRTVLIKYSAQKGDFVKVPKYSNGVNVSVSSSGAVSVNSSTDQAVVLRRPNGSVVKPTITRAGREQAVHARELLISTNSASPNAGPPGTLKYACSRNKKVPTNGTFTQNEEPPVIVAEGLFTSNKGGRTNSENIQLTVSKRKRDKKQDGIQSSFVPGIAGKNCELSQQI